MLWRLFKENNGRQLLRHCGREACKTMKSNVVFSHDITSYIYYFIFAIREMFLLTISAIFFLLSITFIYWNIDFLNLLSGIFSVYCLVTWAVIITLTDVYEYDMIMQYVRICISTYTYLFRIKDIWNSFLLYSLYRVA